MTEKADFIPLQHERLSEDEALRRSRALRDDLAKRRTVRDFSSEPVPYELIENAVATAASAPSGANQQPWTFVVVSDPATKRALREAAEAEERESYERRMSDEWLDAISHLGTDWHKPHLTDAPYLIVVFAQSWSYDANGDRVKHYYATESVGIAVGLLLTSLHTAGLATLTHTPSPMGFLREKLNRPDNERAFVVIPVGYPAPGAQVPNITRKPLEDVLVHIDERTP